MNYMKYLNTASLQEFFKKHSQFLMGFAFASLIFAISLTFSGDFMANAFGIDDTIRVDAADDQTDLKQSLVNMINYFLLFMGILLVVIIIYAGFIILTSQGDDEKLTEGRKIILYAIIGVVIIFLSYSLVNFIGKLTEADTAAG